MHGFQQKKVSYSRLAFMFFVVPILLGLIVAIPYFFGYPLFFITGEEDLVITLVLIGFAYLVFFVIYLKVQGAKYGAYFDQIMTRYGLKGSSYFIFGRRFVGNYQARNIKVSFGPNSHFGMMLKLEVERKKQDLEMSVTRKNMPMPFKAKQAEVQSVPRGLENYKILSNNPDKTNKFLEDSEVVGALNNMVKDFSNNNYLSYCYFLGPNIVYHSYVKDFDENKLHNWLRSLIALGEFNDRML